MIEKPRQKIAVFQQDGSGEKKIRGIEKYGKGLFHVEILSIEGAQSPVIDDTTGFLPSDLDTDLVLDFLKHPDLSHDLTLLCRTRKIPVVASGKKQRTNWAYTPPT